MAEIAYKDVVPLLLERFPEFREDERFNPDELDMPYSIWGGFGRYITELLFAIPEGELDNHPMVHRVFDFTNEMMSKGDEETRNIVVIELFENFYEHRKTYDLARRKLTESNLPALEYPANWLKVPDLDQSLAPLIPAPRSG
ncbi:hypothetical protein [Pelagibius sp.]|uniref:DUF7674 family protein n=1 Tax=Pelagibius sp. TaxID=1931238 RepID=UPI00260CBC7D|nr:hypothetical protein [Pelagibius sp.]